MMRKVSVCAGVAAAVVAFSAGAEEPKEAVQAPEVEQAAPPAPSRQDAGTNAVAAPVVDGPGAERVTAAPPLVDAAVGGAVSTAPTASAAPAADAPVVAKAKAEPGTGEEAPEVHIPFSVSLLPGLSTSGLHTGNVVNTVSLGLVATHAKRVDGVAMAIGANWVNAGLNGAQLAVGANVSGGPVSGGQFSVGGNVAGGGLLGVQSSVGVNVVRGAVDGAQLAVGLNTAGSVSGAQLGVGANIATGGVVGTQLAVGANVAAGPVRGFQAAVGANVAMEMSGVQVSSGISYARHISGGQISLINVGGEVDGAQVGLVNVAGSVDGAQVGLVNVAGSTEGESVGLLNFVGNGQAHLLAWSSDVSLTNVGVKLGGRHLYTLLSAGFTPPLDGERRRYTLGVGFGGHIPLDRFYVDIDVMGSSLHSRKWFTEEENQHVLGQLRLIAGWQIARRFAVFGGVTGNTLVTWDGSDRWAEVGIGPDWTDVSDGGRTVVRMWPGLLAGVQL